GLVQHDAAGARIDEVRLEITKLERGVDRSEVERHVDRPSTIRRKDRERTDRVAGNPEVEIDMSGAAEDVLIDLQRDVGVRDTGDRRIVVSEDRISDMPPERVGTN